MNKKKAGIIIAVVIMIVAAAGGGAWYLLKGNNNGNSADKVFVEKVSSIINSGSGAQNRYSGVVEAQESWKVNKDEQREIKEVFVAEGDMVEEGDPLFEYDMDDVKAEVAQAELDLEGMQNEITDYQTQISQLTKERNSASSDEKYQYTADIQEKENGIKQTQYNIESKKAEIEKKQETIDNAVVTSKLSGVVKSINDTNNSNDFMSGEDNSYMTVLAVGDFRVKGTVSETNIQMLSEEQPVLLRSRIDEEQTWTGTISKIDTQNQITNEDNGVYYEGGGAEKATKYPFYITLDSTDGLMMGQHLFIELDQGQTEEKEGIWLFEGYIFREDGTVLGTNVQTNTDAEDWTDESVESLEDFDMEEGGEDLLEPASEKGTEDLTDPNMAEGAKEDAASQKAYVWVANDRNKLEKREVELGEYDEEMAEYEILSGLTEDDYIAFPMEGLYEGVTTVTDAEEVDYSSPLYNPEGEEGEEGNEEGTEDGDVSADEDVPENGEPLEDGEESADDLMGTDGDGFIEDGAFDGSSGGKSLEGGMESFGGESVPTEDGGDGDMEEDQDI